MAYIVVGGLELASGPAALDKITWFESLNGLTCSIFLVSFGTQSDEKYIVS